MSFGSRLCRPRWCTSLAVILLLLCNVTSAFAEQFGSYSAVATDGISSFVFSTLASNQGGGSASAGALQYTEGGTLFDLHQIYDATVEVPLINVNVWATGNQNSSSCSALGSLLGTAEFEIHGPVTGGNYTVYVTLRHQARAILAFGLPDEYGSASFLFSPLVVPFYSSDGDEDILHGYDNWSDVVVTCDIGPSGVGYVLEAFGGGSNLVVNANPWNWWNASAELRYAVSVVGVSLTAPPSP